MCVYICVCVCAFHGVANVAFNGRTHVVFNGVFIFYIFVLWCALLWDVSCVF